MTTLTVQVLNISYNFKRLGTNRALCIISQKTVTSSVRRALRKILINSQIQVCCSANLSKHSCICPKNGQCCTWYGQCWVNGNAYLYTVQ